MSIPAVMRGLQQTTLNGTQDLRLVNGLPVPVHGPREVLMRVAAAGINFADISQPHGTFAGLLGRPMSQGSKVSVRS